MSDDNNRDAVFETSLVTEPVTFSQICLSPTDERPADWVQGEIQVMQRFGLDTEEAKRVAARARSHFAAWRGWGSEKQVDDDGNPVVLTLTLVPSS